MIKKIIFIALLLFSCILLQSQTIIDTLQLKSLRPEKALFIINKTLVEKGIDNESILLLKEHKADLLLDEHNIYTAIDIYKDVYQLNKVNNNIPSQIRLLNKISNLYIELDKFSEAITNLNKVEKLINNNSEFSSSRYLANMAQMFFKTKEVEKSKRYYHLSFIEAAKNNNEKTKHENYLNFANTLLSINELDSAMIYSNSVLAFSKTKQKLQLGAKALMLKGDIYEKQEDFILAEKQFKKAIKQLNSIKSNATFEYKKLGNFYKRVYLYDYANKNLLIAAKKTSKENNIDELQGLYHDLMENSLLQRRTSRAKIYLNKYDSVTKIISKHVQNQNISYIKERYNIQQDEIEFLNDRNTLLKKESEIVTQKKIAKKNKWIYFVIIILLIVLFLSGFLYYRYNKLNIEKSNIQLKNTVLRLQMNPHFIFNSLTAIQNSILKNDALKSAELIAVFSKLIRQNLDYSEKKSISLADEIDMLKNYLKTQKFRFNDIFDFKIKISEDLELEEIQIPPMLLQPFIENSIEHGLKHKEKGGLIKLEISSIDNGIRICIEDNGIGMALAKKQNKNHNDSDKIHAIQIFRERLKNRQKKEMNNFVIEDIVDIVDKKDKVIGTRVSFNLID